MAEPLVFFLDKDLRIVSDPVQVVGIDATARHLYPGVASVTAAASPALMGQLATPGRRCAVVYDGQPFLVGPLERPHSAYRWSARGGTYAEPGQVTFHFTDFVGLVAGRRVYPDPTSPWADQSGAEHYTDTGTASTVMRALVDLQAGPGALASPTDRRVPGLVLGTDPAVGGTVSIQSRFEWLGDVLRRVVTLTGGGVGFRTVADLANREVTFDVYSTVDRSASVIFSRAFGNLMEVTFHTETPRTTAALVAGQGEGTARTTVERTNVAAETDYDRLEDFVDQRNTDVLGELEAGGDERLAEQAASAVLVTETIDTPDQRYGVHYQLGDQVTHVPFPGFPLVDVVREARLTFKADEGTRLATIIGSQAVSRDPEWLRQARALARQLGTLQAT